MAVDGCAVTFDAAMRGLGGATFHFFTARRVCIWRTMSWQDVRLSVCLSVCLTPVLWLNGYTYPFFTLG